MRYQFIYNAKESRYCGVDCYYIYDTKDKKYVYDLFENIACVHVDRQKRIIYFCFFSYRNDCILIIIIIPFVYVRA